MQIFLSLLLFSSSVFAWGPTGHRVVGELAQIFLDPKPLSEVKKILDNQSLARVSTWPDEIRSLPEVYSYTFKWHYTDWPKSMGKHDEKKSSGTLIGSIKEQIEILQNRRETKEKRAFALKFLIHLVGDLHMPLHVGNATDAGGNKCPLIFKGEKTNLHALWDEGIINFSKLSYTELTDFLLKAYKKPEIEKWRKGEVLDWASESKKLREEIYPKGMVCSDDEKKLVSLSYDYSNKWMPVIEERLFQAGLRLAVILNSTLK